jgi:hypothetical protein
MYKKIAFLSCLLPVCLVGKIQAETIAADLLVYSVEDQHAAVPYLSRILVSDGMLRMDEVGDDRDDNTQGYLLFDRKQRLVLSVDPETRSVMVIGPPADGDASESPVTLEIESRPLDDAPLFAGKKPQQHIFHVQGKECFNIVTIEGEMPRAMNALREMNSVLAERHRRVLESVHDTAQEDCKFLVDAYRPGSEYSKGLLLTLMNGGETRQLVDYKQDMQVDSGLFEAPLEYDRFPMP